MGNVLSDVISRAKIIRAAIKQLLELSKSYDDLQKRIDISPGLPVKNPTKSFWMDVPSPVASHRPAIFPGYADVVIIGSGITGTSIARTLVTQSPLNVVMLEARETCSGATGRNGGHIKPPVQHDYQVLKKKYGIKQAQIITRFRRAHVKEMLRVADEDGILKASQARAVDTLDVYYEEEMFEEAKKAVADWKADMPNDSLDYAVYEKEEAIEKFHLSPQVVGVVYNMAGAIHAYQFVTGILEKLLQTHGDQFYLSTQTPCVKILEPTSVNPYYTVITTRGAISTPHVVHATNAWTSHLLEPMRTKIVATRATMTAQRPGTSLSPSSLDGHRSWVFYDKHIGYDYLTQLPSGEHELMFGGGFFQGGREGALNEIGNANDAEYFTGVATHLAGALPILFGERNWGAEMHPNPESLNPSTEWFEGRVKAVWSGLMGISADTLPWVGRIPPKLAGRAQPPPTSAPSPQPKLETKKAQHMVKSSAPPGEWMAGGYSGEGMGLAFLSGEALAYMVMGAEREAKLAEWFPEVLKVTEKRWRKAKVEDLLDELE